MKIFNKYKLDWNTIKQTLETETNQHEYFKLIKKISLILLGKEKNTTYTILKKKLLKTLNTPKNEITNLDFLDEIPEIIFKQNSQKTLNLNAITPTMLKIWEKLFSTKLIDEKTLIKQQINKLIETKKKNSKTSHNPNKPSTQNTTEKHNNNPNIKTIETNTNNDNNNNNNFNNKTKIKKTITSPQNPQTTTSKINPKQITTTKILKEIKINLTPEMKKLSKLITHYSTSEKKNPQEIELLIVYDNSNIKISNNLKKAYHTLIKNWTKKYNKKIIISDTTYSELIENTKNNDPILYNIYKTSTPLHDNQTLEKIKPIKNSKTATNTKKIITTYTTKAKKFSKHNSKLFELKQSLIYLSYAIQIEENLPQTEIKNLPKMLKNSTQNQTKAQTLIKLIKQSKKIKTTQEIKQIHDQLLPIINSD